MKCRDYNQNLLLSAEVDHLCEPAGLQLKWDKLHEPGVVHLIDVSFYFTATKKELNTERGHFIDSIINFKFTNNG